MMRTRTTRTRTALAGAILAALPLATGALRADRVPSADAAAARSGGDSRARPQWAFVLSERPHAPQLIACPSAGWRCALYTL